MSLNEKIDDNSLKFNKEQKEKEQSEKHIKH
jgi:hypothetical protein